MNCHACSAEMLTDEWGHHLHVGPCPGYPIPWTSDFVPCPHCGHDVLVKQMPVHHKGCTADHPRPPTSGKDHCRSCTLHHRPKCPPSGPTWPLEPLLEAAWARTPERTITAAADALGMDDANVHRFMASGLSDDQADRWACRLGMHPSLIWPSWFDAAPDPLRDAFLATGWRTAWLHDHPDPQPIPQGQEAAA